MKQTDLFGETDVKIPNNPTLESMARQLLRLIKEDINLIYGDRVGDVDRKLRLAVWMDQGLAQILKPEQLKEFEEWALDPKRCIDPELVRRARQHLVQHDYMRLSGTAIKDAEQQRARLAQSFHKV